MAQYEYPITKSFNSWILKYQILEALGIGFSDNDVISGMSWNSETIRIHTLRDLSPLEKQTLDTCMTDPSMGEEPNPAGYTIFEVKDLCDMASNMKSATGLPVKLINYIHYPPPKNGNVDRIEIWIQGDLTTPQINAVKTYYGGLITKKV